MYVTCFESPSFSLVISMKGFEMAISVTNCYRQCDTNICFSAIKYMAAL